MRVIYIFTGSVRIAGFLFTIVVSGAAWFLASWLFPHDQCALWALLPGASFSVGIGVLQLLTITYVVHVVTRKSDLYGAVGIALALLLWTYFAGRLLTAAVAARRRCGSTDRERTPPRQYVGASLIRSAPPGGRTPTRQPPTPSRPVGGSRGPCRRSRRSHHAGNDLGRTACRSD